MDGWISSHQTLKYVEELDLTLLILWPFIHSSFHISILFCLHTYCPIHCLSILDCSLFPQQKHFGRCTNPPSTHSSIYIVLSTIFTFTHSNWHALYPSIHLSVLTLFLHNCLSTTSLNHHLLITCSTQPLPFTSLLLFIHSNNLVGRILQYSVWVVCYI